jgi:hypothetical protein
MTDAAYRNSININAFALCHQLRRKVGLNIGPTCRVVGDEPALRILWRDGREGGMRPLRQGAKARGSEASPADRHPGCGTPRLSPCTGNRPVTCPSPDLSIACPHCHGTRSRTSPGIAPDPIGRGLPKYADRRTALTRLNCKYRLIKASSHPTADRRKS